MHVPPAFSTRLSRRQRYPSNLNLLLALAAAASVGALVLLWYNNQDNSTTQENRSAAASHHHVTSLGGTRRAASTPRFAHTGKAQHGDAAAAAVTWGSGGGRHSFMPDGLPEVWARGPPALMSNNDSSSGGGIGESSVGASAAGDGGRLQRQLLDLVGTAKVAELRALCGRCERIQIIGTGAKGAVRVRGIW